MATLDRTLYIITPAKLARLFVLEADRVYFSRPVRVLPVPYTGDTILVHDPVRGHTYPTDRRYLVPGYALTRRQREAAAA